jgi:hypothetical protein
VTDPWEFRLWQDYTLQTAFPQTESICCDRTPAVNCFRACWQFRLQQQIWHYSPAPQDLSIIMISPIVVKSASGNPLYKHTPQPWARPCFPWRPACILIEQLDFNIWISLTMCLMHLICWVHLFPLRFVCVIFPVFNHFEPKKNPLFMSINAVWFTKSYFDHLYHPQQCLWPRVRSGAILRFPDFSFHSGEPHESLWSQGEALGSPGTAQPWTVHLKGIPALASNGVSYPSLWKQQREQS